MLKKFHVEITVLLCYNDKCEKRFLSSKEVFKMKITEITPQKKREKRYNVFIDGEFAFGIDGVDMLYYKLKEGEELTQERYDLLMEELSFIKAREEAMHYLGFKSRTEKEVREKLHGEYRDDIIDRVVELLKGYKLIDDEEYARLYVTDCLKLKGWGKRRILDELAKRGINRDKAEKYLDETEDIMLEKAKKLLEKRIGDKKVDMKDYKKHFYFFVRRGFDFSTAKEALKKYRSDDF